MYTKPMRRLASASLSAIAWRSERLAVGERNVEKSIIGIVEEAIGEAEPLV